MQNRNRTAITAADIEKFNETTDFQREQWNAANAQAVEQSNVQWRRQANLADTAAQNAANQQKPNITALGSNATVGSSYGGVTRASGTSFSTPIVSGMMACLIQAHPEKKPSHINWAVMQSASKRFRPDYEDGFGIPNFYLAHQMLGGAEPNEVQILEVNTKKCKNQIDIGLYIPQGKALTQEVFIQKNGFFGLFGGISKLGLESAMLEGSYIYKKIALTGKKLKKINFIFNIKTNDGEEQKGFSYTCRTKQLEAFETTALISD